MNLAGPHTPPLGGVEALLEDARVRTLRLIEGVSEADLHRVHDPGMSPLFWDLGHIAAFEDLCPARSRRRRRSTSTTSGARGCSSGSPRCPSTTPPAASAGSSTATLRRSSSAAARRSSWSWDRERPGRRARSCTR
ncbi:MAG: DinB family protein [Thermoleophilaceae bacterium]|nr:DinB family protein [Thermoleophilaceae bacterium]